MYKQTQWPDQLSHPQKDGVKLEMAAQRTKIEPNIWLKKHTLAKIMF